MKTIKFLKTIIKRYQSEFDNLNKTIKKYPSLTKRFSRETLSKIYLLDYILGEFLTDLSGSERSPKFWKIWRDFYNEIATPIKNQLNTMVV